MGCFESVLLSSLKFEKCSENSVVFLQIEGLLSHLEDSITSATDMSHSPDSTPLRFVEGKERQVKLVQEISRAIKQMKVSVEGQVYELASPEPIGEIERQGMGTDISTCDESGFEWKRTALSRLKKFLKKQCRLCKER